MKYILSLILFIVVSPLTAANTDWLISPEGIGPIRIGMTLKQAEKASGSKFNPVKLDEYEDKSCYYATLKGTKNLTFMVNGNTIVRVNVSNPAYSTDMGAKIGDTETHVQTLYHNSLKSEAHHYDEKGHYLTLIQKPQDRAIRFETDGKLITLIYSGRINEVHLVENCL